MLEVSPGSTALMNLRKARTVCRGWVVYLGSLAPVDLQYRGEMCCSELVAEVHSALSWGWCGLGLSLLGVGNPVALQMMVELKTLSKGLWSMAIIRLLQPRTKNQALSRASATARASSSTGA